jgi:hypothetical protein
MMSLLVVVGHIRGIVALHETVRKRTRNGYVKMRRYVRNIPPKNQRSNRSTHSMLDCSLLGCILQHYILLADTGCSLADHIADNRHIAGHLVVAGSSFDSPLDRSHLRIVGNSDLVGRIGLLAGKCSRLVEMNLLVGYSSSFVLFVLTGCLPAQRDRLPMN